MDQIADGVTRVGSGVAEMLCAQQSGKHYLKLP